MIWAYLAGLATLPALYVLYVTWAWLNDRNLQLDCTVCGARFGVLPSDAKEFDIKPTLTLATRFKFKWHRWTGQCKNGDNK